MWDEKTLLRYLARNDAANFYGLGHGCPPGTTYDGEPFGGSFLALMYKDLNRKLKHRYRFAFLDGCLTDSDELLRAFGADSTEIGAEQPLPIGYYIHNKRPAAFLCWSTTVPARVPLDPPLPDGTSWQQYAALCNWHQEIVFYWTLEGYTLEDAVAQANWLAMSPGSSPQPRPVSVKDKANHAVPFSTVDNLRCHGYSELRFNEFNHRTDTWPWWP